MERKTLTCNSFVFYGSFYESISVLPLENQARIYDAIFKFSFEDVEVDLDGIDLAIFLLIKPQLVANRARYENGCKGGRPRKEETETKPNNNLTETKTKPNENDNDNENETSELIKEINKRIEAQDTYGVMRGAEYDEIVRTLAQACVYTRPRRFGGRIYKNTDFRRVAENITPTMISRVANALYQNSRDIDDRAHYILGVFAVSEGAKNDNCASEYIFAKHE